jgi:hypothetical protein
MKAIDQLLVRLPNDCPISRIKLFGIKLPPLCKLNPFYGTLMRLKSSAIERLSKVSP